MVYVINSEILWYLYYDMIVGILQCKMQFVLAFYINSEDVYPDLLSADSIFVYSPDSRLEIVCTTLVEFMSFLVD